MTTSNSHVLGYFGSNNAGDDAFADFWQRSIGISASRIHRTMENEESIDTVCLGGGAVLNSFFMKKLPREFNTLHLVGVSFPYGDSDIKVLEPIKHKVGRVVIRSKEDCAKANEQGYNAEYVPDLIFGHDFEGRGHDSIEDLYAYAALPIAATLKKKNLVILLSGDYWFAETKKFHEGEVFKDRLAHALDNLAPYYNIIMLPFSVWYGARDYLLAADITMRMEKRTSCLVVEKYLGPDMLYSIIRQFADIVVSMKYHGLVFSIGANVPFVNIGNTRKNIHLCRDEGLEALSVPLDEFHINRFWAAVKAAESSEIKEVINEVSERNREAVRSFVASFRS